MEDDVRGRLWEKNLSAMNFPTALPAPRPGLGFGFLTCDLGEVPSGIGEATPLLLKGRLINQASGGGWRRSLLRGPPPPSRGDPPTRAPHCNVPWFSASGLPFPFASAFPLLWPCPHLSPLGGHPPPAHARTPDQVHTLHCSSGHVQRARRPEEEMERAGPVCRARPSRLRRLIIGQA